MSLNAHAAALAESLAKANLVPGPAAGLIAPDFRATTKLDVSFGGKAVELGTFFRAGECKVAPAVSFAPEAAANGASAASYTYTYTFILTDPDAPTPDDPKFAFWRHWVLSGLRPRSVDAGSGAGVDADAAATSRELTAYLGPGPKDE